MHIRNTDDREITVYPARIVCSNRFAVSPTYPFHVEVIDAEGPTMTVEFPTMEDAVHNFENVIKKLGDRYDVGLVNAETDTYVEYWQCGKF